MNNTAILSVNNLSLTLDGKKILNGLSLDIWEGHIHAIVGVNGAGKSTLVNTIMGLSGYEDFDGDITFRGTSLREKDLNDRARLGITLGWQEPARFEGITIRDYVLAGAEEKSDTRLREILDTVGMDYESYAERAVDKTLSGGERKKIELASILAMKPALAFLDEPDSGIDIESITMIFTVVKKLRQQGTTIVFITHSNAVLEQADHAFLLCHGKLVKKGSVDSIQKYFTGECGPCDVHDPVLKGGEDHE